MTKLNVGVIGCGQISKTYLPNLVERFGDVLKVVACSELDLDKAREKAEPLGIKKIVSTEALLADDDIELAINLTNADVHPEVNRQVLAAGKHLYSEKPLALSMAAGRELVEMAEKKNLRLSCAPDTLLGSSVQACRRTIDNGLLGAPVAVSSVFGFHTQTERYFTHYRGPLLDLSVYEVAAMTSYFGPVRAVSGASRPTRAFEASDIAYNEQTPATAAAVLEFHNGLFATHLVTCETIDYLPSITAYGTDGVLECTDPNMFHGVPRLRRRGATEVEPVESPYGFTKNARGIGVADMALAMRENRPHRLSAELALHTLEVMLAVIDSGRTRRRIELTTTCDRPPSMPELAGQEQGAF